MKLGCDREKLKQIVSLAERVTGKNLSLTSLNYVFLEARSNSLIIRSTNLDLGVEWQIPAIVDTPGEILVSGVVLANLLSNLNNVPQVVLEVVNNNLSISTAKNATVMKVYPNDDFPTLPDLTPEGEISFSAKEFVAGLKSVAYAAALNDIKPEIASVYLFNDQDNKQEVVFVATDSFRLAEKKVKPQVKSNKLNKEIKLIIPIRNINELIRLLENSQSELQLHFNRHQLNITTEELVITSRLIDGIFPDYRQIMPSKGSTQVSVSKNDLLNAVKLSQIFTDRLNHITIKVRPEDNLLEITSQNGDVGENTSLLSANIDGEELVVNLNLRYLLDGLQLVNFNEISLQFNGKNKPILLSSAEDKSFRYLIMPLNR